VPQISHETDEQLELYALGRLNETQAAAVEEHLLVCPACQKRLDEVEGFAFAMRDAIAKELDAANASWLVGLKAKFFSRPVLVWSGGLAVLVIAAALYLRLPGKAIIAPTAELQLSAVRGETQSVAPARETALTLSDAPAGIPLRVEAVDSNGGAVWTGTLPRTSPARIMLEKQLSPGDYFVRLYAGDGKLLHEYGFRVRTPL
jgi:anti-sigma factor RsiW